MYVQIGRDPVDYCRSCALLGIFLGSPAPFRLFLSFPCEVIRPENCPESRTKKERKKKLVPTDITRMSLPNPKILNLDTLAPEDIMNTFYGVDTVLTLDLIPGMYNTSLIKGPHVSVRTTKITVPSTMSLVTEVQLVTNTGGPLKAVLKLFDRRFAPDIREGNDYSL